MNNLSNLGLQELSLVEKKENQGGFVILGAIAAVCGIIYLAGEIAYMKGRADGHCDD